MLHRVRMGLATVQAAMRRVQTWRPRTIVARVQGRVAERSKDTGRRLWRRGSHCR